MIEHPLRYRGRRAGAWLGSLSLCTNCQRVTYSILVYNGSSIGCLYIRPAKGRHAYNCQGTLHVSQPSTATPNIAGSAHQTLRRSTPSPNQLVSTCTAHEIGRTAPHSPRCKHYRASHSSHRLEAVAQLLYPFCAACNKLRCTRCSWSVPQQCPK